MKLYTRGGDKGKSFVCGRKIDKLLPEMNALASLDEANSLLGLIRSRKMPKAFKKIIKEIQEDLFIIQANIGARLLNKTVKAPAFSETKIKKLEWRTDQLTRETKPAPGFVISGEEPLSAWLDYGRAVVRRAERDVLKLAKKRKIEPRMTAYLNRLSSLLFAMARSAAKKAGRKERHPSYS